MGDPGMLVDVWDTATFDEELRCFLKVNAKVIRDFANRDKEIFLIFDYKPSGDPRAMRPENTHAPAYYALLDRLKALMNLRVIRAWHYTRMTDDEVDALRRNGVHMSTLDSLQQRLQNLVDAEIINAALADALTEASPLNGDQRQAREGRFWLVSHPSTIDDSGVTRLLRYWGGEAASFWTDDEALLARLEAVGRPRVLELAVPLDATEHGHCASEAVVAAFARTLGCVESSKAFDLYVTNELAASALIAVHTEGEPNFASIGRGYPVGFVDVDQTYWRDLTGEED